MVKHKKTRKITKELITKAAVDSNGTITDIAKRMGVSFESLWYWRQESEDNDKFIIEVVNKQREVIIDKAEKNLVDALDKGNENMTKFALSTIGKNRGYVQKTEVENTGTMTPIQINVIMPEDKKKVIDVKPKQIKEDEENE